METTRVLSENEKRQSAHKAYMRGVIDSQLGNHRIAIICFEQAVNLDPPHSDACRGLASAYEELGDSVKAQQWDSIANSIVNSLKA